MINYLSVFTNTDGNSFPDTAAVNSSGPGTTDGTEFIKAMIDDLWGFNQALLNFTDDTPNGSSEADGASQRLDSILKICANTASISATTTYTVEEWNKRGVLLLQAGVVTVTLAAGTGCNETNRLLVVNVTGGSVNVDYGSGVLILEDDEPVEFYYSTASTDFEVISKKLSLVTGGAATIFKYDTYFSTSTGRSQIQLRKSANDTPSQHTIVVNSEVLGDIQAYGSDGTNFIEAARISFQVDDVPGTNDMPGRIVFSTTADGASSVTERMRIDSNGKVGIGSSSPDSVLEIVYSLARIAGGNNKTDSTTKTFMMGGLHYTNSEEPSAMLLSFSTSTDNDLRIGGGTANLNASTVIRFYTATNNTTQTGTERLTIESDGDVITTCKYRDASATETVKRIKQKIIEIGDWNMDTTDNVSINTGLSDTTKIRCIDVLIRNDSGNLNPLFRGVSSSDTSQQGFWTVISATNISLLRLTGGHFDSTNYDSTSYNRGFIYITYEE